MAEVVNKQTDARLTRPKMRLFLGCDVKNRSDRCIDPHELTSPSGHLEHQWNTAVGVKPLMLRFISEDQVNIPGPLAVSCPCGRRFHLCLFDASATSIRFESGSF